MKKAAFASLALALAAATVLAGCTLNSDDSTSITTESAVYATVTATSSSNYLLKSPVGTTISNTRYEVLLAGGLTLSDNFRTALVAATVSSSSIKDVSPYFSVTMDGVSGYSVSMTAADVSDSDTVNGTSFFFTLYSEKGTMIAAPSFKSGYIRVNMAANALSNNNGGLTTRACSTAEYAVGQYATVTQTDIAYTHNSTYYQNTVTVVLNDVLNTTKYSEIGYTNSNKVISWLTLPSYITSATVTKETVATTSSSSTITYVVTASKANSYINTNDIVVNVPSEYLTYYANYSTTATVPMLSSLTSSVISIPEAATWEFINPYLAWNANQFVTLTGTKTTNGTLTVYAQGDTFKESTPSSRTCTPTFTFYDADGKETSDIVCTSDTWTATSGASSGTITYNINAAKNSESDLYGYYGVVTFNASTLTNNEITPKFEDTYKVYITKYENNISIGTPIAIAQNANTTITATNLGTFTIALPASISNTAITDKTVYGGTSDFFTLKYFGTQFQGSDISKYGPTIITATMSVAAGGTTATVTVYATGTTATSAEGAYLYSGEAAPLYMTLTSDGVTAFKLDSGLTTEFEIGTINLTD